MNDHRRKTHRVRNKARRHLIRLWKRYGGKCCYCSGKTMPIQLIHHHGFKIVELRPHWVAWKLPGWGTISARIATVEHTKPILSEDANEIKNLKLACSECNGVYSRPPTPTPPPLHENQPSQVAIAAPVASF